MTSPAEMEARSDIFQKCAAIFLFVLLGGFALLLLLCILRPEQFPAKDNFAAMGQKEKMPYYAGVVVLFLLGLYFLLGTFCYKIRVDQWGVTQCSAFATNRAAWTEIASYKMEMTAATRSGLYVPVLFNARGNVMFQLCVPPVDPLGLTSEERARVWSAIMEHIDAKRAVENQW